MNSANIHETAPTGLVNKHMTHSISVNTLSKKAGSPSGFNQQDQSRPNPHTTIQNLYSRYSPHSQQQQVLQQQHSQSTVNLIGAGSGKQLSYGANATHQQQNRQSATNGIKMIPSSQIGSNVGGARTESPATGQQSLLMAHHQANKRQGVKTGAVNSNDNSGGHLNANNLQHNKSSFTGTTTSGNLGQQSHQNMLNTINHVKERSTNKGQHTLKQAKSFTSAHLDHLTANGINTTSTSSKPPSNNKNNLQGQYTRTIDQTISSKITNHHSIGHQSKQNASSSHDGLTHHQSLSHMRTQATLSLKQHSNNSNIVSTNSRHQDQNYIKQAASNNKQTSNSAKMLQEGNDNFEKHGSKVFAKTRLSQQINGSTMGAIGASSTSQNNRLLAHKTSLNDFKKPVSLTSNPITSKNQAMMGLTTSHTISNTSSTPSSQIVSAHTYQPIQTHGTSQSTTGSLKQKPPISGTANIESSKHVHSHSHQQHSSSTQGTTSSSSGNIGNKNTAATAQKGRISSPRNQLNVFTKKQSMDVTGKHPHGGGTKQNFSHTTITNLGTFSPKDDDSAKRRELVKTHVQHPQGFKSHSHVNNSSSLHNRQSGSATLKNQVSSIAKNEKRNPTHQSSSSQSALKSRNLLNKGVMGGSHAQIQQKEQNSLMKGGRLSGAENQHPSQTQTNSTLQLENTSKSAQKEANSHASRQTKKSVHHQQHQYPQTTKNATNMVGRSSSVSMNTNKVLAKDNTKGSHQQSASFTNSTTGQQKHQQPSVNSTLDRFKDKHPKLHQSSDLQSSQQAAKVNGSTPTIQGNTYRHQAQRGQSPSETGTIQTANEAEDVSNTGTNTASAQQIANQSGNFVTQLSHKMAQNRVPQIAGNQSKQQSKSTSSEQDQRQKSQTKADYQQHRSHNQDRQQQTGVQQSSVNHSNKMTSNNSQSNTQIQSNSTMFQRKVRSATRASEVEQQTDKDRRRSSQQTAAGQNAFALGKLAQNQQHKLSQQKITDRPQSASAGQKFIGRQQNLKELFERNWQSVNVQNKVDPQSGEATQIRSLTVVDINCMVHEDQQEAAVLPLAPGTRIIIPNHEPTKCSNKRNGIVRAYAANTNQGLVRNYNEDRVSIILNIVKPEHRKHETWPTCSFFGVYDGHGGSACAEYLRDNLHHYVIKEESFPWQPEDAIRKGFEKAEARFLEMCQAKDETTGQMTVIERSGSCAIVVLIVGEICYIANVGDSRAVLSSNSGQQLTALSRDHKPSDTDEYKRIIQAGGQIYQTTTSQILNQQQQIQMQNKDPEFIVGPIRVLPGRLSVCRTFGDPEAKLEYRGGNPNVVTAIPDIRTFQIAKQHDFIALASDGIFDKLNDDDCGKAVWMTCETAKQAKSTQSAGQTQQVPQQKQPEQNISVHQYCGLGVEGILKNSLMRQSLDNVTVVMVAFANFKKIACGQTRTNSADKREHRPESIGYQHMSNSSATKTHEQAQNDPTPSKGNGTGTEKENSNFMSNTKKTAAARSHQQLMPRTSSERVVNDQVQTSGAGNAMQNNQERQLKRQSAENLNSLPRQHSGQPRTRSQNNHEQQQEQSHKSSSQQQQQQQYGHQQQQQQASQLDGYSIRQQQQQASKLQQQPAQQQQYSFQKGRPSTDPNNRLQSNNFVGQQAKPPMSSSNTNASQQAQKPIASKSHHNNVGVGAVSSSGMRSQSVKEVPHLQSNNHTHNVPGDMGNNNFHGRLNQLANLNSNKSLGGASSSHQQQQHSHHQQQKQQIMQQQYQLQQNQQQQQERQHSSKPSPSQINHHSRLTGASSTSAIGFGQNANNKA